MTPLCYVTTSWDDGHPSDLRVAEMLARFEIPGTFYIPAASRRALMRDSDVRALAQTFDVGAHTLRHLPLTGLSFCEAAREIGASKDYIQQIIAQPCSVFAAPFGRFHHRHLEMAEAAGFRGFRTTELMSLKLPRTLRTLAVVPTTLQLFRHSPLAYWKNALRRLHPLNVRLYLFYGRAADLVSAFQRLLAHAIARGGVLHVWGHGWEIEECGAWNVLDSILQCLAERRNEVRLVSNAGLCDWVLNHGDSRISLSTAVLP